MGSFNGPDATLKAYELVNQYNKDAGEKLASHTFTENNEIVIVVVDQLAKRVHKLVKQAGDIVYVDGTGSLDRLDTQLVKLMTCSPAGGLPLGFMLLGSKNEATTTAGMNEFKSMLSKDAFFKRGDKGPSLFMTDDDPALINSLQKTWPQAKTLLCVWHILQVCLMTHDS